jgi:hypothetical protein
VHSAQHNYLHSAQHNYIHSARRNYIHSAQRNYVPSAQRNDGVQCTNNGVSAAPSGAFNLKRKTTPPGPSHNKKRLRANTQGEATAQTYSTSVNDVNKSVEENDESDLTELDTEEGEGLGEYKDVDEEEEEEEEEDDVEEEGNEEEELVSSQDIEHSVIVVAPRR